MEAFLNEESYENRFIFFVWLGWCNAQDVRHVRRTGGVRDVDGTLEELKHRYSKARENTPL